MGAWRVAYLGNHPVSIRDNPPSFIVFLYSSKGTDHNSYPNENLGEKKRDDEQKNQEPKMNQPSKALLNLFHTGAQPQKRHQEAANANGLYKMSPAPL